MASLIWTCDLLEKSRGNDLKWARLGADTDTHHLQLLELREATQEERHRASSLDVGTVPASTFSFPGLGSGLKEQR